MEAIYDNHDNGLFKIFYQGGLEIPFEESELTQGHFHFWASLNSVLIQNYDYVTFWFC